jgi:hypothetical protein
MEKSLSRFTRRIFVSIVIYIPALFTSFGWCRKLRNGGKGSPRSHLRKSNQIPAVRLTHPFENTSADMKVVKRGELESYDRCLAVSFEFLLPGFETSLPSRCRKYQAFRTFQKPSTLGNSQSTNMKLPGDRHIGSLVSRTSSQTPLRGSTGIWQAERVGCKRGTAKLSNRNRGLFLAYISPD